MADDRKPDEKRPQRPAGPTSAERQAKRTADIAHVQADLKREAAERRAAKEKKKG